MQYKNHPFLKRYALTFISFIGFMLLNAYILNSQNQSLQSLKPFADSILNSDFIFAIFPFLFMYPIYKLRKVSKQNKLDSEIGLTPIKVFQVGAEYTNPNKISSQTVKASYPFVQLRFYENFLVISSICTIAVKYKDISSVLLKKDTLFTATPLKILDKKNSRQVSIWSKQKNEIFEFLNQVLDDSVINN